MSIVTSLLLPILLNVPQSSSPSTVQVGLQDIPPTLQGQTWGKHLKNRTVNDVPMDIAGVPYDKGVGTHAHSCWVIPLDGLGVRFQCDVGVPESNDPGATVKFKVYGDRTLLFESGVMTPRTAAKKIDVELKAFRELRLIVTDAGDGTSYDRANWAAGTIEFQRKPNFPSKWSPPDVINGFSWERRRIPVTGDSVPSLQIVDASVESAMRRYGIVGCSVTITDSKRILYSKGFGMSELPNKPFLPTTASRCGSVAKSIAGLAALALVDQGKLSLDEPIMPILRSGKITPALPRDKAANPLLEKVLVRDLLDHSSGISGTYTASYKGVHVSSIFKKAGVATSSDVVAHCLGQGQIAFEPGQKSSYSNANFVILGRIIEVKSGMPYGQFLQKVVLPTIGVPPNQMFVSNDQYGPRDSLRGENEAAYYMTSVERQESFDSEERILGSIFGEGYRGYASKSSDSAGGTASSSLALGKMILAIKNGVLSSRTLQEITQPPTYARGRSSFYSKGFDVHLTSETFFLSHGGMTLHAGGAIGFHGNLQFAVVSNWNNASGPFVDSILPNAIRDALGRVNVH